MAKRPSLPANFGWTNPQGWTAAQYKCGWCDKSVAADKGYQSNFPQLSLRICPLCSRPTFLENQQQTPGIAYGSPVKELPADIEKIYEEARECCSHEAYTGAVLLLRKLLMNIAVSKGAAQGEPFVAYVQFLSDKGYVPPDGKGWVDHIRKKGNEANHEITLMNKTDAEELIVFSEMLLKFIYEFPKRVPQTPTP
jgi:uncharacterized protein DUF4145